MLIVRLDSQLLDRGTVMETTRRPLPTGFLRGIVRAIRVFRNEMLRQSAASVQARLSSREVAIKISQEWARRCRSPLANVAIALSGVSVSFAPAFLYAYGRGYAPLGPGTIGIPLCWLMILIPGIFFLRLGHHVLDWVRHADDDPDTG